MFTRTSILFLLLTGFAFAQSQTKEGTAIVSGRVTLKGEPASGVAVALQLQTRTGLPDMNTLRRTRTDADGRFLFSGVNAGQYLLTALSPGLIAPSDSPYEPQGKALSVSDGETVENLDLQLKRGGVIAGRITDAQGNPVVETTVKLTRQDANGIFIVYTTSETSQYSRTDDLGSYRLFALLPGSYKVSVGEAPQPGLQASARNYLPQTFYPSTPNEAQAKIIEVSEGSEAANVNIKVGGEKEVFDVFGKVVDAETGQPVAGVNLGFGMPTRSGRLEEFSLKDVFTNAQGEFEFHGMMPGKYVAFISSPTERPSEVYSEATPFEVSESNLTGLEVKALRGIAINGKVIIEGADDPTNQTKLSQLSVSAHPVSRNAFPIGRSTKVAADGNFRIAGLKPGKVSLTTFPRLPGLALTRIEQNGVSIKGSLDLQTGENPAEIRLTFSAATGALRGQVKFIEGIPPENVSYMATVTRVTGTSTDRSGAPIDARGNFVVTDLAAGEYEVGIMLLLRSTPTPEVTRVMELLRQFSQRVSVAASRETQTELVIDLSKKEGDR